MALSQLGAFMQAIKTFESGGNYSAKGPYTGSLGHALGAYQIMEANWPSWSAQAGLAGASWTDPSAQDAVAGYKMTEYYNKYGSWDLVAVAWFGGPGAANTAATKGLESIAGLSDVIGTSMATYVSSVVSLFEDLAGSGGGFDPAVNEVGVGGGGGGGGTFGGFTDDAGDPGAAIALPSDGEFVSVGGQTFMMITLPGGDGAEVTIFWELTGSSPPAGASVSSMNEAQWAESVAANGWVDAGSDEAFRGFEPGGSFLEIYETLLYETGLYGSDALSSSEVMGVLAEFLARPDMSPDEFIGKLEQTDWWDEHTELQKAWNDKSTAQQNLEVLDQAGQIAGLWFTYVGENIELMSYDADGDGNLTVDELKAGNLDLYNWAFAVASGAKTQQMIINESLKSAAILNPDSPYSRIIRNEKIEQGAFEVELENKAAQIKEEYANWGVTITDRTAEGLARRVSMNEISDADWLNGLKDQAQALYPHKAYDVPTLTWAQPYLQTYSSLMEVPSPDLWDKNIQKAMQEGQTLFDFSTGLRESDQWKGTSNARDSYNKTFSQVGRLLGF